MAVPAVAKLYAAGHRKISAHAQAAFADCHAVNGRQALHDRGAAAVNRSAAVIVSVIAERSPAAFTSLPLRALRTNLTLGTSRADNTHDLAFRRGNILPGLNLACTEHS